MSKEKWLTIALLKFSKMAFYYFMTIESVKALLPKILLKYSYAYIRIKS